MSSFFLIFDRAEGILNLLKTIQLPASGNCVIIDGSYGENLTGEIAGYLESCGCRVEIHKLRQLAENSALCIKDEYIHFIYEAGRKKISGRSSLIEWFLCPGTQFSLWWPSLAAEKNTVKSPAYFDLSRICAILEKISAAKPDMVIFDFREGVFRTTITRWASSNAIRFRDISSRQDFLGFTKWIFFYYLKALKFIIIHFMRLGFIRLEMNGRIKKSASLFKKADYAIITYFPFVDMDLINKRIFESRFFAPIQGTLKEAGRNYICIANIVDSGENPFREIVSLGKKITQWGEQIFFVEEFMGIRDAAKLIVRFHWFFLKYLIIRHRIKKSVVFAHGGVRFDAWRVFREEFDNSFGGPVLASNLMYYLIFNNLSGRLKKECAVLYPAEMQGWEKSMCAAMTEHGITRVLGIQHAAVPKLLLNYFFDKAETEPSFGQSCLPRPKKLGCAGNIPKMILQEMGWPAEDLFVLGGIRFDHYKELLKKNYPWEGKKDKVVVALPIKKDEAVELVNLCHTALSSEGRLSVIFKSHPCLPMAEILKVVKLNVFEQPFSVSNEPLSTLLPDSKVLIVTESSSTFEGLACQCQIIIPFLNGSLDLNPLSGISNLGLYVNSSGELKDAVLESLSRGCPSCSNGEAHEFLQNYITLRNKEDYLKCIEEQLPV